MAAEDGHIQAWNQIYSFANSMALKCAMELGIPDIIHQHGKPIGISDLVAAIPVPAAKTDHLRRLMRLLVHNRVFSFVSEAGAEEGLLSQEDGEFSMFYGLTPLSKLLVRDKNSNDDECMLPHLVRVMDPLVVNPWHFLSQWFKEEGEAGSPFQICYGIGMWEYLMKSPNHNRIVNQFMPSASRSLMSTLVRKCSSVFDGLNSVIDVGGGTGGAAHSLAQAFPHLKLTVLDLPHVVPGSPADSGVDFVAGDMFQWIPPADAVFLKWILHDWSDEDCVKILRKCKEAIPAKEKGAGKVIIVDMVVNSKSDDDRMVSQTKFFHDLLMIVLLNGKERTEKEWKNIFHQVGFSRYGITQVTALYSIIEVFP